MIFFKWNLEWPSDVQIMYTKLSQGQFICVLSISKLRMTISHDLATISSYNRQNAQKRHRIRFAYMNLASCLIYIYIFCFTSKFLKMPLNLKRIPHFQPNFFHELPITTTFFSGKEVFQFYSFCGTCFDFFQGETVLKGSGGEAPREKNWVFTWPNWNFPY